LETFLFTHYKTKKNSPFALYYFSLWNFIHGIHSLNNIYLANLRIITWPITSLTFSFINRLLWMKWWFQLRFKKPWELTCFNIFSTLKYLKISFCFCSMSSYLSIKINCTVRFPFFFLSISHYVSFSSLSLCHWILCLTQSL
jgi:hypothetical protein